MASGQAKAISQGSTHSNINLSFRAFSCASVGFLKDPLRGILYPATDLCCICTVTFEGHGLKLQTKVTVLFGNTIYVDSPSETLANIHVPAEGYKFPVKFRSVIS